ncbi:MAG: HflK protein [Beggiatoa sp. IS2]|nr:MAG: HflK protein [Beggiatoa sp. IS2]
MPWNEPGGNGNKDPWDHQKNEPGPPDLDEIVRKMKDKLFGRSGGGNSSKSSDDDEGNGGLLGLVIFFVVFVMWIILSIYIVQPAEQGVETRFGRYSETTEAGIRWHWYPIERMEKINVEQVRAVTHKALMLTQDENIVEIELIVQYRIKDAGHYLFNVREPDNTLQQATESALREIVGTNKMDDVITSKRTQVAMDTKLLVQEILNRYEAGLDVLSVNMQDAQPPAAVQEAFADVIKAREDEERHKNKAEAYANEIVQKAGGTADKLRQEAQAYKAQVVAQAEGQTQRFLSVLKEYEKAPEITRKRLYLESMESVLTHTGKIMVDVKNGNNFMVLDLGNLLNKSMESTPPIGVGTSAPMPSPITEGHQQREDTRSRGVR